MTSHEMQHKPKAKHKPQPRHHRLRRMFMRGGATAMPGIPATVTFGSGVGAVIDIGQAEGDVTGITVLWGGATVYESTTPNAAGQTSINANFTAGQIYVLEADVTYAGSTQVSKYTGNIQAVRNTAVNQHLTKD